MTDEEIQANVDKSKLRSCGHVEPLQPRAYIHCRECLECLPEGASPRDFQRLAVYLEKSKAYIWCTRHDKLIVCLGSAQPQVAR